jgi:hypothetical protein
LYDGAIGATGATGPAGLVFDGHDLIGATGPTGSTALVAQPLPSVSVRIGDGLHRHETFTVVEIDPPPRVVEPHHETLATPLDWLAFGCAAGIAAIRPDRPSDASDDGPDDS